MSNYFSRGQVAGIGDRQLMASSVWLEKEEKKGEVVGLRAKEREKGREQSRDWRERERDANINNWVQLWHKRHKMK